MGIERQMVSSQRRNLTLYTADDVQVIQGERATNNLYWLHFHIQLSNGSGDPHYAFTTTKTSWQIWHKRFRHIGYTGLSNLYTKKLVAGFDLDPKTPKPDCVPCTEAKMTCKPYPSTATHTTTVEALTHIDLWGKYDLQSSNKNQYYILFVDDYSRYVTVHFLKAKSEASKHVCNYLTHMTTRQYIPLAICVDRGTEFINNALTTWTKECGIEIKMTAPYSPSQNGVAEHINCTLVELARAMLAAQKMPEFLWEHAIAHAAYLRNRSYSSTVPDSTPYERRHGEKPDVTHLREFGSPVWILTDGQHTTRKMLPKATEKLFIRFEDGPRAITYYNKATRKTLSSRNYQFHNNNVLPTDYREIQGTDPLREGEGSDNIPDHTTQRTDTSRPKKRPADEHPDVSPRKTRGVCLDFK